MVSVSIPVWYQELVQRVYGSIDHPRELFMSPGRIWKDSRTLIIAVSSSELSEYE